MPHLDESVYSPLPYGNIDELRKMLVEGPNFRGWHWAQNALGRNVTLDWFSATNDMLDLDDVDCVWRKRTMSTGEVRLEMWSPGALGGIVGKTDFATAHISSQGFGFG